MASLIQDWLGAVFGVDVPVPGSLSLLVVAIMVGTWIAVHRAESCGISRERVLGYLAWIIAFGLVGSRVGFWLEHLATAEAQPLFAVWRGGLSLFGGLAGVVVAYLVVPQRKGRGWGRTADALCPALPIGLVVGRLGCFLNGDDFGIPTGLPWGVRFPLGTAAHSLHLERGLIAADAEWSLPVHPTQLYEIAFGLAVVALLRFRARPSPPAGRCALILVAGYAAFRFALEFLREPSAGRLWGIVTVGQMWSLAFLVGALVCLAHLGSDRDHNEAQL